MALTALSDVEKIYVKPHEKSRNMLWFFMAAAFLILLDQLTKILVKGFTLFGYHHEGMYLGESHPLIGDVVRLTFVENPGMAFGIQFGFAKIFLTLFSLIAGSALLWYLSKIKRFSLLIQIGITLLIAGALGNFIDRCFYGVFYGEQALFYGYVVDFIQVDIPDVNWFGATYTHWPVFNIADSCVSVGMVLLLIRNKYLPTLADIKNAENPSINSPEQTQSEASQTDTTLSDNVSDNENTK